MVCRIKNIQKSLKKDQVLFLDDKISIKYLIGMEIDGRIIISKTKSKIFLDSILCPKILKTKDYEVDVFSKEKFLKFFKKEHVLVFVNSLHISLFSYNNLKNTLPKSIKIKAGDDFLSDLRLIKDVFEIKNLKKAADITHRAFLYLCSLLKNGITEKDLFIEFECFIRKNGAESNSFTPSISFGKNTSIPHHTPSDQKLKAGDVVLFDLGVKVNGYASDMTRCVFFEKKENAKAVEIFKIVKSAKEKALKLCKIGAKLSDIDNAARNYIKKMGYEKDFIHSIGHGVGLDVHERPFFRKKGDLELKKNMVITIEPGIYLKNKFGIRLEDTIIITSDGYQNLYLKEKLCVV
jgi:Xaa-Pro aminopeptidase